MNKTLEIAHFRISSESIQNLTAVKKKRLIMLTNIMRDMNLFRKLMVYRRQQDTGHSGLSEAAFVSVSFSLVKILASKCYEAWRFIKSEKISKESEGFSVRLQESWADLNSLFAEQKNTKLLKFIRDKFTFHYASSSDLPPLISNALTEVGDIDIWVSTGDSGNDVFPYSGTVMLIALRNEMIRLGFIGDEERLISDMQRIPIEVSFRLNEFCKAYLTEKILDGAEFTEIEKFSVDAPLLSQVFLPLIVKNDMSGSSTNSNAS